MKSWAGAPRWRQAMLTMATVILGPGCGHPDTEAATELDRTRQSGVSNPASVHCVEQGHRLETRTDENGGQYGVCLFADGGECEEWAYYRGECDQPADGHSDQGSDTEQGPGMANPASVYCVEQGHRLEIRTDENGGQYGVCLFADGGECEEWAYYRGTCGHDG